MIPQVRARAVDRTGVQYLQCSERFVVDESAPVGGVVSEVAPLRSESLVLDGDDDADIDYQSTTHTLRAVWPAWTDSTTSEPLMFR